MEIHIRRDEVEIPQEVDIWGQLEFRFVDVKNSASWVALTT